LITAAYLAIKVCSLVPESTAEAAAMNPKTFPSMGERPPNLSGHQGPLDNLLTLMPASPFFHEGFYKRNSW